ncbi:hypothetical protein [Chamaesiphon sp. VAR_69_metabat_338]|uniref:hypothetical protein n=1 Tax=Chamaesiphon sp. VAR_69_metabat_338 TaxID=2964704 RepID=UPI00286EAE79|nr:hypothetical protein [Chamaesiphon sp. VAR_69_metabat_338]
MSKIQISELNATGTELFQGAESFLTELQPMEASAIYGGACVKKARGNKAAGKRSGGKSSGGCKMGKSSGKSSDKTSTCGSVPPIVVPPVTPPTGNN